MRIHLPAETWAEVLEWLDRHQFAKLMEQLWDREFSPIAAKWFHEWSKNIKISSTLEFDKETDANGDSKAELYKYYGRGGVNDWLPVPIADVAMPMNICTFEHLHIRYLDNTVLAFLRRMCPLFQNIHLSIGSNCAQEIQLALHHLLPMFCGEFESVKLSQNDLQLLNNRRYNTTLLNTKLLAIDYEISFNWCSELLANWLFSKRADGQPRMLVFTRSNYSRVINIIEERFMAANAGEEAFFIVRFNVQQLIFHREGTIRNTRNGQQLIMLRDEDSLRNLYILFISCPMDVDHEQLAEWRHKVVEADSLDDVERDFQLISPTLGPLDAPPIDDSQPTDSAKETNANNGPQEQQAGTSSNAQQNLEEEGEDEPDKKRARFN